MENYFKRMQVKDLFNLERSYRLSKYFLGEPQPPFKLIITPTDRCNLNCIFCPNYIARQEDRHKREDELEKEEWMDVIRQAVDLGIRQWCFLGGGEPLLRSEIILPALDIIRKKHESIDFEIITNGVLLTQELLEGLVDVCKEKKKKEGEHGLLQLTISIHGSKKTYEAITGADMYDTVVGNLQILRDLKNKVKLKYPVVQINIVLNKKNLNEIENLLNLYSNDLKVEQIALHGLRGYDETKEIVKELIPDSQDSQSIINLVNTLKENLKSDVSTLPLTSHLDQINDSVVEENTRIDTSIEVSPKIKPPEFMSYKCFEPWYDMMINPNGTVSRCAAFTTRTEPISVKKETLKEIWYGPFLNEVRENIKNGKLMEGCNPCGLMSNTIVIRETMKMFIEKFLEGNMDNLKDLEPFVRNRIEKYFGG